MPQDAVSFEDKRTYPPGFPKMDIRSFKVRQLLLDVTFFVAANTYPQIPVALICSKTSPCFGSETGASTSFKQWSAVACNDGLGRGVLIMLPPFKAVAAAAFRFVIADTSGESPLAIIAGAIVLEN